MMMWRARLPRPDDAPEPIHDGDTLWLETDQGDFYRKVRDIRLQDVYAPELNQVGGIDVRDYVRGWVAAYNQGKWPFMVGTVQTPAGKDVLTWNRYVCQVYSTDMRHNLNVDVAAYVLSHGYPGGTGS